MRCKCGNRLSEEEENEGSGICSSCMWDEEMAFLEDAYQADLADMSQEQPYRDELPYIWTPDSLVDYAARKYRVRTAGGGLPMLAVRRDGWQVGERWRLSTEEACNVLNERGATPITSDRFKRGSVGSSGDRLDMPGNPA